MIYVGYSEVVEMNYTKQHYQNALIRICQDKVNVDDVRLLESLIEEHESLKRENLGLKVTNRRMQQQIDKYYRAVTRLK